MILLSPVLSGVLLAAPPVPPGPLTGGGGCEAIQKKIDALPAEGGEVRLGPGTWTCKAPIVVDRDGVCLHGSGPGTLLRLADGANAPVLVLGGLDADPKRARRDLCVTDLRIDGNRRAQQFECWGEKAKGGPCDADRPVRNNGITLRRVADARVERVQVDACRSGGIVVERQSDYVTVRDVVARDHHFDGVAAYRTRFSTFADLSLRNNCHAGLSFDLGFDHNLVRDVVITRDADIQCGDLAAGTVGAFIVNSHHNVLRGLTIRNMRQHGIFLAQGELGPGSCSTHNVFVGVSATGGEEAGLRINDAACGANALVGADLADNRGGEISLAAPGLLRGR